MLQPFYFEKQFNSTPLSLEYRNIKIPKLLCLPYRLNCGDYLQGINLKLYIFIVLVFRVLQFLSRLKNISRYFLVIKINREIRISGKF